MANDFEYRQIIEHDIVSPNSIWTVLYRTRCKGTQDELDVNEKDPLINTRITYESSCPKCNSLATDVKHLLSIDMFVNDGRFIESFCTDPGTILSTWLLASLPSKNCQVSKCAGVLSHCVKGVVPPIILRLDGSWQCSIRNPDTLTHGMKGKQIPNVITFGEKKYRLGAVGYSSEDHHVCMVRGPHNSGMYYHDGMDNDGQFMFYQKMPPFPPVVYGHMAQDLYYVSEDEDEDEDEGEDKADCTIV